MACSSKDDCDKREENHYFFFTVLLSSTVNEGALELTMTYWISFSYRRFLRQLLITFSGLQDYLLPLEDLCVCLAAGDYKLLGCIHKF